LEYGTQEWLKHLGRSESEIKSLLSILQQQSGSQTPLALIYFATFVRSFQSLIKTITIMQACPPFLITIV
jgi:hypothetical protein